jgi:hypothetical protein
MPKVQRAKRASRIPRVLPAALLLLTFIAIAADGQGEPASAPFISRLKATLSDYQVKLTWKDSPDDKGVNVIYRFTEEITDKNIDNARLIARVPNGVEYYIDVPPDTGNFFYAILVEDPVKLYKVIIPFRNKTNTPAVVTTTATEEQLATRITGIKAAVSPNGTTIDLSFQSSAPNRELLAFWGTTPFRRPEDLLRGTSKSAVDPMVGTYQVHVIAGVDYYFAVFDAGLYMVGKSPLEPGQNTTTQPVQIPLPAGTGAQTSLTGRGGVPLPVLQLTENVESGGNLPSNEPLTLPAPRRVSPATARAIDGILAGIHLPPPQPMKLQILELDATPDVNGEIASLQTIVQETFPSRNFAGASQRIGDFLSLPRKPEIEARARFYLGEIYFFLEKTREAFMEFLLAENSFYHETQGWLDACLEKLETADKPSSQ